jgi:hypothetical protein
MPSSRKPEEPFLLSYEGFDPDAGVQAAKPGDMGTIGIGRKDDAELLAAAGADIVVRSLDEVDLTALAAGQLATAPAGRARRPSSEL